MVKTNKQMDQSVCVICESSMTKWQRYPNAICMNHTNETVDRDGNPVQYENKDIDGGFISLHTIHNTVVTRRDPVCYVRGRKCIAGEARFGGIVIQYVVENE